MAEQLRFCQHKNTIFQFPNTILNGILLFTMPFVVSHLNVRGMYAANWVSGHVDDDEFDDNDD